MIPLAKGMVPFFWRSRSGGKERETYAALLGGVPDFRRLGFAGLPTVRARYYDYRQRQLLME